MSLYLYIAIRNDGVIKVGYSNNPEKRIRQFGHNTPEGPYSMTLVASRIIPDVCQRNETKEHTFSGDQNTNAKALEKEFKSKFADYLIRGEWYKKECLADMICFLHKHPMNTKVVKVYGKSNGGQWCLYSHNQLQTTG